MFRDPRWAEYQDAKVLKIKVQLTEEDERKNEEFVAYIKNKITSEKQDAKNK